MSSRADHGTAAAAESADVESMQRVGGMRPGLELERMTNALLREVGISTKYITLGELQESASSMFVAIFEALYDVRLEGVVRKPTKSSDYVHNAQLVLDALSQSLKGVNVSHITSQGICSGDVVEIQHLVEIFRSIRALMRLEAGVPASPVRVDLTSPRETAATAGADAASGPQSDAQMRELRRQEAEVRARRQREEQAGRRRSQQAKRRPGSAKRPARGTNARKRRAQSARRRGRAREALFSDQLSEIADGDHSLASSSQHSERELMDELSRQTGAGLAGVEYPTATTGARATGGWRKSQEQPRASEEEEEDTRHADPLARLASEFPALWHQLRRAKRVREQNERNEGRRQQQLAEAVRAPTALPKAGVSPFLRPRVCDGQAGAQEGALLSSLREEYRMSLEQELRELARVRGALWDGGMVG